MNSYKPYYPELLQLWQEGDREAVLLHFAERPLMNLSIFCVDLFMKSSKQLEIKNQQITIEQLEGIMQAWASLEKFGQELAWCEDEDYEAVKGKAQILFYAWREGKFGVNEQPYKSVTSEIVEGPACLIIAFMDHLMTEIGYPFNLLQAGYFAGALQKAETYNGG